MACLIEGYNYDIFISYRQKDNKYDGWVTEFVENLKKELEATFKEDISVYFDINPHDGLRETHEVNDSLKEKLKCLIFIPIISRTYCDPNSFAWQNEFTKFIELTSNDRFGLKIKLPGGNVASRVLPVRIYDLNKEDINLCETLLGGVLRGIEFIYKSSGVNRPLRANEDHAADNLNKTYYRDQINKVAYSILDIINGIKVASGTPIDIQEPEKQRPEKVTSREIPYKKYSFKHTSRKRIIAGSSILLLTVLLVFIFMVSKGSDSEELLQKAINAVDPYTRWPEYTGRIRLRNIQINAVTEYNEIIEINRRNDNYYRTAILKDHIIKSGIKNGSYFYEVWNSSDNTIIKTTPEDSIDKQDMLFYKEHHTCQIGLPMELKNSGLKMSKVAKRVNFQGNKCYSIDFLSDSTLQIGDYFKNTNWTIFLDQKNYILKGYKFENLYGVYNMYVIISGNLIINDLNIPMCKSYFLTSNNSFLGIDLITRPD